MANVTILARSVCVLTWSSPLAADVKEIFDPVMRPGKPIYACDEDLIEWVGVWPSRVALVKCYAPVVCDGF